MMDSRNAFVRELRVAINSDPPERAIRLLVDHWFSAAPLRAASRPGRLAPARIAYDDAHEALQFWDLARADTPSPRRLRGRQVQPCLPVARPGRGGRGNRPRIGPRMPRRRPQWWAAPFARATPARGLLDLARGDYPSACRAMKLAARPHFAAWFGEGGVRRRSLAVRHPGERTRSGSGAIMRAA